PPSRASPGPRARRRRACRAARRRARTGCVAPRRSSGSRSPRGALRIVALARAPARILEDDVLEASAGVVYDVRLARMLRAPFVAQHRTGLVPRHAPDPSLEGRLAPALVAHLRPDLVGVRDVLLLVEEPHLVAEDVAEDEEPSVADLELRRIAAELHLVRGAV